MSKEKSPPGGIRRGPELAQLAAQADGGGVAGEMKNLLFATVGPKPKVVLRDAINDLQVVANVVHWLVYDRPWRSESLTLRRLGDWWAEREQLTGASDTDVWRHLLQRLARSLDNDAERRIFNVYASATGAWAVTSRCCCRRCI